MYLMDNAYNGGAALNGKCRAFATGGGCRICNDLFYIHEKTHLAREGKCKTCLNGESCKTCSDTHFMTVDGECKNKSAVVVCAEEISGAYGCSACLPGYFLTVHECVSCCEAFDRCAECTATTRLACSSNSSVLVKGKCVGMEIVEHCTAAEHSVHQVHLLACTDGEWRRVQDTHRLVGHSACGGWWVDPSGDHCRWRFGRIPRLPCSKAPAGPCPDDLRLCDGSEQRPVCRDKQVQCCYEHTVRCPRGCAIPIDAETRARLCDGNSGRRRFNVKVTGKDCNEGRPPRVIPGPQLHHRADNFPRLFDYFSACRRVIAPLLVINSLQCHFPSRFSLAYPSERLTLRHSGSSSRLQCFSLSLPTLFIS